MWVPLVENREYDSPGADYFVEKYVEELFAEEPEIDTIILGCTRLSIAHREDSSSGRRPCHHVTQGELVAASLRDYLKRHPEMDEKCTRGGACTYLTTENAGRFASLAGTFLQTPLQATHITL